MKRMIAVGYNVSYDDSRRDLNCRGPVWFAGRAKVLVVCVLASMLFAGNTLKGRAQPPGSDKPKITGVELLNKAEEKKPAAATPAPATGPVIVPVPVAVPSKKKKTKKQIAAEKEAAEAFAAAQVAAAQAMAAQSARIKAAEIAATDKTVTFYLQITGENLGGVKKDDVRLFSKLNQEVKPEDVQPAGVGKLLVKVTADVPMEINRIKIKDVEMQEVGLTITGKKDDPPGIKEIETTFETFKSPTFPNQYTVFVNKKSGAGSFESDPNRMRVEILPPGASNISIRSGSNPQQLVVDFLAPEKFEVKNIIVTVYDSGNLDSRKVVALATQFKEKADPNQPVINDAELIYIQRGKGFGRLKIEGSGFGDYERLPMTTEEILMSSFRRYSVALSRDAASVDPPYATASGAHTSDSAMYLAWKDRINQVVKVELVPRNPDLRIDNVDILYIDDKLVDVYFEFYKIGGYSQPFRLARVSLTVKKNGTRTAQTVKYGDVTVTLTTAGTFFATHDVGPKRDKTLQYHYSILDKPQAFNLFGQGVSDSFYVIQLSLTNTGTKKVSVPLASIQAEIEWSSGVSTTIPPDHLEYLEGPETIAPIPLEAVSGFFDAYVKRSGTRAKVFNLLQGVAALGSAVIPFAGPSFRDGITVLASAGIPALKIVAGDLTGQQLQNLTGLSWQTVEVIAPGGGSINKYIFVQRGAQEFFAGKEWKPDIKKLIRNIVGIEVVGFEVIESEAKQATPAQ